MIELQHICAGYGKEEKLHDVSVRFESGSITALLGPNGSGKSTLLKTAAGLLHPTAGTVLVDGSPLNEISPKNLAQRVAFLPQSRNLPNISVRRLVLHGRFPYLGYPRRYADADYTAVDAAIDAVGIAHLAEKNMTDLSGGERQKAYLAMALAQQTDVLLLDEPTTYLDIDCQLAVWRLAKQLRDAGKTVGIVTHDLSQGLRFADGVYLMQAGRVAASGGSAEVAASGQFEQVFHVQVETIKGHYWFG